MATGDTILAPAQAAGFASLFGHIEKGSGDTLNLPEGMLNIGGNSEGYLLEAKADWDPTANNDGSFASLSIGDDVYIYAVQSANGIADWVASKNSTVPDGYSAATSRKVGGCHYGRYRPISERYNKTFTPGAQILPNSCWDLKHRPKCDPTGMVEVIPGRLWADIYLNSEGAGTWPETIPESRYNATPLSGTEGYSRYLDLPVLAANAGKRLPFLHEFYVYADGSPEGGENDNDTAWSDTSNSGRTATGTVDKAVSTLGVVDAVGNLWESCVDLHDVASLSSTDYEWDRAILENGKDSSELRGELYHVRWRFFLAGGGFDNGGRCGARCAYSSHSPESVHSYTGLRCVCDSL